MDFSTPYYLIDRDELDKSIVNLKEALSQYWNNYVIGYSYKTNALPWIINYFNQKGCYAEVVSEDEFNLAKKIGVDISRIIYNGPIKSYSTFITAIENGAYINIDSQREIEWICKAKNITGKIGIRVNFDIEKMCPQQSSCGNQGGRFGFCYENRELQKAIERLKENGIKINGLHLHISSKTRSVEIYRAIAIMACRIAAEYHLKLDYIDIGGGFFGGLPEKPQFVDYFRAIKKELTNFFCPEETTLVIEPGMSLIGSPISYITSVTDIKDTTYGRFIVIDGSRTNIDPLFKKQSYFYCVKHQDTIPRDRIDNQTIVGFTCMEPDRLMSLQNSSELHIGDRIVFQKVGAYTMCLTPLFIQLFPDVYVKKGNKFKKIREKWKPDDLFQESVF